MDQEEKYPEKIRIKKMACLITSIVEWLNIHITNVSDPITRAEL